MQRAVTERDFRMPEFRNANPEDYEFRADGKIVRKDRWETAIHKIRNRLVEAGLMEESREFEIPDVIKAVEALIEKHPAVEKTETEDEGQY
jgi:hypothetical protein